MSSRPSSVPFRSSPGGPAVSSVPSVPSNPEVVVRHDWTLAEVRAIHDLPLLELVYRAQTVHRATFGDPKVQLCSLLSIKTGGCPEDCAYCPQSARYDTGVKAEQLMETGDVLEAAPRGAGRRRHPLLHGRRLARGEGRRRSSTGCWRWSAACARSAWRPAARWACSTAEPGPAAQGGRPLRLQPQPRHQPRVLRGDHLHPRLPGPAPDPGRGARGGDLASAPAASSGWASRSTIAASCCARSPTRRPTPSRCRSTRWWRCRARRSRTSGRSQPVEMVRMIATAAHPDAERDGPAVRRPAADEPGGPAALHDGRRQLALLRREAAHHRQPRVRRRHGAARAAQG